MKSYVLAGLVAVCVAGFLFIPFAGAEKLLSADAIVRKVFHRFDGDDSLAKVEMVLMDNKGNERKRMLDVYTKDFKGLSKNFMRFIMPADIKGTGFLSWEKKNKDDIQHLYLPGLGRSRRVVSSQKDMSFVNSDFTYEDMQRRMPEKDSHKLLKQIKWNGHYCFVIESIPLEKKSSQYGKFIQWVERRSFVPVRVDFYNKKGKLSKRLIVKKLSKIQGIWTPMDALMKNIISGHQTIMSTKKIKYNLGLKDEIFTLRNLEDY